MSQPTTIQSNAGAGPNPPSNPRRRGWQVGLRTLLLLIAVVAVGVTIGKERDQIATLQARISTLRPIARDLIIEDPNQVAVVKLDELWIDDNQWDVYLPAQSRFFLAIATHAIDPKAPVPPLKRTPLAPGRHLIRFEQTRDDAKNWHLTVSSDGQPLLQVDEPAAWNDGRASTGGGHHQVSQQFPLDAKVELFRRRCLISNESGMTNDPGGPLSGVLIWIEP